MVTILAYLMEVMVMGVAGKSVGPGADTHVSAGAVGGVVRKVKVQIVLVDHYGIVQNIGNAETGETAGLVMLRVVAVICPKPSHSFPIKTRFYT